MRVENPSFSGQKSPVTQADKDDLSAALVTLAAIPTPTLVEIRAAIPAGRRGRFTDGMLCQVAADLGLRVDPE